MSNNHCMTVGALYAALEARVPASLSCPWDHDGLSCCPDPDAPVTGVLVALDATEDAVALAAEQGCNVILTHHPMLFGGLAAVTPDTTEGRKTLRLVRDGIATMAFHTRLDTLAGGVNDILAARLGLADVTAFGCNDNPAGAPMGRVGTLATEMSLADFAEAVKTALSVPATLGTPYIEHLTPVAPIVTFAESEKSGRNKTVRRVAVLGGAGEDEIAAAVAAGADTFVTGEIDYHKLCDAPYGDINLVAAGHYFTEFPVCTYLADLAAAICADTPVHIAGGTRTRAI